MAMLCLVRLRYSHFTASNSNLTSFQQTEMSSARQLIGIITDIDEKQRRISVWTRGMFEDAIIDGQLFDPPPPSPAYARGEWLHCIIDNAERRVLQCQRIQQILETVVCPIKEESGFKIQVLTRVAFPLEEFDHQFEMAAWSPDFDKVGVFRPVQPFQRNVLYDMWVASDIRKRYDVEWSLTAPISDPDQEFLVLKKSSKQSDIYNAPWNKKLRRKEYEAERDRYVPQFENASLALQKSSPDSLMADVLVTSRPSDRVFGWAPYGIGDVFVNLTSAFQDAKTGDWLYCTLYPVDTSRAPSTSTSICRFRATPVSRTTNPPALARSHGKSAVALKVTLTVPRPQPIFHTIDHEMLGKIEINPTTFSPEQTGKTVSGWVLKAGYGKQTDATWIYLGTNKSASVFGEQLQIRSQRSYRSSDDDTAESLPQLRHGNTNNPSSASNLNKFNWHPDLQQPIKQRSSHPATSARPLFQSIQSQEKHEQKSRTAPIVQPLVDVDVRPTIRRESTESSESDQSAESSSSISELAMPVVEENASNGSSRRPSKEHAPHYDNAARSRNATRSISAAIGEREAALEDCIRRLIADREVADFLFEKKRQLFGELCMLCP